MPWDPVLLTTLNLARKASELGSAKNSRLAYPS